MLLLHCNHVSPITGSAWRAGAAMGLLLAMLAGARAQETPLGFSLGPGESVEYDSNFFRGSGIAGSSPVVGETVYASNLVGNFHQIYGREDVTASATIGRMLYAHLHQFDFTQQDIRAALQSNLAHNIGVSASIERTASLAHFADLGSAYRNIIEHDQANVQIDLPVLVDLHALVGGSDSVQKNSLVLFQTQNLDTHEINGGVRFQPATGNHVDLLLRSQIGTYPNGSPSVFISPGFHERGVDLRVDWTFSGASRAQGHIGYVERRNDEIAPGPGNLLTQPLNRDFSGPEFDLSYLWQLSAASHITISASRQIGAAGDNSYLSAANKTLRIAPGYQLSAKIGVDAYAEWSQRNYFSNVVQALCGSGPLQSVCGLAPESSRLDISRNAGLRAVWNPRRWLQANIDVHRENRNSTFSFWSYTNNVYTIGAQTTF